MRFLIALLILSVCACTPQIGTENRGQKNAPAPIKRYGKNDRDSAPKGPLPSFFQLIMPKNEPLSRYGNPGSYAVAGHHYHVLPTANGYKERGMASWYGTKFHSQRTSSGEHYDMYAMTAAHRTLPLPSYLRVKNLENGREAIVKVNDRGPFHSDRVIDLSYAAATKLGILPRGTARVEIVAVGEKGAKQMPRARYYVQAGAFGSNQLASALQAKLKKLTRSPITKEKYRGKYIVKVGPFPDHSMTVALRKQLEKNGVHGAFSMLQ